MNHVGYFVARQIVPRISARISALSSQLQCQVLKRFLISQAIIRIRRIYQRFLWCDIYVVSYNMIKSDLTRKRSFSLIGLKSHVN